MALLHKKPPHGLLEIFERTYVFDCCFNTKACEQEDPKAYAGNIIREFKNTFPESSINIFNFRKGDTTSKIASLSSEYDDITITNYPQCYKGCPLLSLEVIHLFLKNSETWLSSGRQNVLLMHSEVGGWPVLAFMMAALLLYGKHCIGEFETLDMVHKLAPRDVLPVMLSMNPVPSQLRYLRYVSRRTAEIEWRPPADKALVLDYVLIRRIPDFDGKGGCCPIFRIYGPNPLLRVDKTPKLLFSTPRSKNVQYYNQAEGEVVKIDINCCMQGDIVVECVSLHDGTGHEKMMFRAMFNTTFIESNMLVLNRDEIDLTWDAKDQFPKDFKTELHFSEMDPAIASMAPVDLSCFDKRKIQKKPSAEVEEMVKSVEWLVPTSDAAFNRLHTMPLSDILREMLDHTTTGSSNLLQLAVPKRNNQDDKSITSSENKLKRNGKEKAEGKLLPQSEIFMTWSPPCEGCTSSKTTGVESQPTKIMKPLHRSKLNRVAQGSLGEETQKSGAPETDVSEVEPLLSIAQPNSDKAKAKSRAVDKTEQILDETPYDEADNKQQIASRVGWAMFWPLVPCGWWWQRWLGSSPSRDL